MQLKRKYATADEIPAEAAGLYEEKDGAFVLAVTSIEGFKGEDEFARMQTSLAKAREDYKAARDKLASWSALGELDKVRDALDEIDVLRAGQGDGKTPEDIEKLIAARVQRETAPLLREKDQLVSALSEQKKRAEELDKIMVRSALHDSVRSMIKKAGVRGEAEPDACMLAEQIFERADDGKFYAREGVSGVTPGASIDQWVGELRNTRPHWWADSNGGGARGARDGLNGAANPFSHAGWNLTAQGQIIKDKGRAEAERLAKAAGTSIGGPRPPSPGQK